MTTPTLTEQIEAVEATYEMIDPRDPIVERLRAAAETLRSLQAMDEFQRAQVEWITRGVKFGEDEKP